MTYILYQTVMTFIASFAVSIAFNAPRKELLFCGLNGALGWFIYTTAGQYTNSAFSATLISAMVVTAIAKYLSYQRLVPSTLYHIAGILPLVPGVGIYNTMVIAIGGDALATYASILEVVKIAGAIGGGSTFILALPPALFQKLVIKKYQKD